MPHVVFLGGNNVVMRGIENEDRQFVYCPDEDVPFVIDVAGVTPPNPKYYISRECCDHHVLFHLAEGSGFLDYNSRHFELHAGDTVLLAPGSRNCYYAHPEDPFRLIWVNFFCDWMDSFIKGLELHSHPVVSGVPCGDQLLEIVRLAKATPNNNHLCFPVMRIVNEILLSLAERIQFESRTARSQSPLAQRIKDLLDESIYGRADVGEIASRLYVSKSSVYREFEKFYGDTPYRYVLNRKIELAKSLLQRTNYSIADISRKLSFSDEFCFSNQFKRKTGLSPSTYRKQLTPPSAPEASAAEGNAETSV